MRCLKIGGYQKQKVECPKADTPLDTYSPSVTRVDDNWYI